ncbi:MAG: phosphonate ABC transporter ATP-binding protein [Alphaproteobacteria bacterium]|nr:phosphonate ABC transporter ATP-binding protein [Alphaproteobacteria bacterium]MBV9375391.1 phosphonate ABC transporter ATP-binding protein [Alphaproteobacteria bacterium]
MEVHGLGKRYDGKPVLSDVSFTIMPGEVVALIGPSGAGKTTLFRCLARLAEADDGEIHLLGRSIRLMRSGQLRTARRDIGLVFQQHNLIRRRSALHNVLAGRLGRVPLWRAMARRFKGDDRQRAYAALDRVDLLDFADRRADRLSGGQQQRVAIARVLAQESRVILADEPVASLDPAAAVSVLSLLRDIAHDRGITVLCSLHQIDLVPGFADRVVVLRAGRLVIDDAIKNFRSLPAGGDIYADQGEQ